MAHASLAVRVGGFWLAVASALMVAVFLFHGPLAPSPDEQMKRIADHALRWTVVHWTAASALSLYALAGLVVIGAGSRLTAGARLMSAWAALPVSALWAVSTAVAEASVVTQAALAGSRETFTAWWIIAEARASGFAFFAVAVAVIAGNEVHSLERATPVWSAWIGRVAAIASFAGWALGVWFGVPIGNLLWLGASILMCLWLLAFGVGLMRHTPDRRGD